MVFVLLCSAESATYLSAKHELCKQLTRESPQQRRPIFTGKRAEFYSSFTVDPNYFWSTCHDISMCHSIFLFLSIFLFPTSQPSMRRQRIVPREECCMQKNSRSAAESVSVSVRCKNLGFSQLQGRNYWSHCSFQPIRRCVTSRLVTCT